MHLWQKSQESEMNDRQQKYKANRIAGMNQYNAAKAAGYSENYSKKGGSRIEKLVKVGLADAFEQAGLTDKAIIAHALEGLASMRTVSAIITGKDAGAADKDFIDVPDWTSRHKYFITICELTNRLKRNGEAGNNISIVNIVYGHRAKELNANSRISDSALRIEERPGQPS